MLNGNEKLEEQARWLDALLKNNPQNWTIVAIHQPCYATGTDRDNPDIRKLFVPVFDKYSVALVLQGHDHNYGRTYKLRNGKRVADTDNGTVYIVSVRGTKMYPKNKQNQHLMVKIESGRQLFQVIRVNENVLHYESFNALGVLYDSFELGK